MEDWVACVTGAVSARRVATLQTLWSGYGSIVRYALDPEGTAVVKVVDPPARGDRSHRRKLRSYTIEDAWYRRFAASCGPACRVPRLYGSWSDGPRRRLALEDLDVAGYPHRTHRPTARRMAACLDWLAAFHATFLGVAPAELWPAGTYWHLETRPDELAAMGDEALREAAPILDGRLRAAQYRTLVHGDAKPANFCFSDDDRAAAVDFQYVGGGIGVQDVAYLLAHVVDEQVLDAHLDHYFMRLGEHLAKWSDVDVSALEAEWRALYPCAWADFHRFLNGWAPQRTVSTLGLRITRTLLSSLG